jgi:hypothetical protein
MFFNAHTYHSIQRNNGTAAPLRVFGALLADSALTGVISWTDLHEKETIQDFIRTLDQSELQLGLGLMDHYVLDLKSHEAYEHNTGYAYSHQTPKLRELVSNACGLESPEKARGLAHNFIEAGVDINLLHRDDSTLAEARRALDLVSIDIYADRMASVFRVDGVKLKTKLYSYKSLLFRHDLKTQNGWVKVWTDITALLLDREADEDATRQALSLATELTADDYLLVIAP